MNIKNYDYIIIFSYFIILLIIGLFRNQKSKISQTDYILQGRKLSLPGFIASLVSTWYGAILGIGENTYLYGIQTWFIFGLPYYIFAALYAIWLSEKIWGKKLLSIPDVFRNSYGNKIGILSATLLFFLSSPAPYILSLGILIKFVLNINLFGGVLIATMFSIFYLWNGGLNAIIKTDYFQILLMFLGFFLLVIYSWIESISPIELYRALPSSHITPTGGMSYQYIILWFFIAIWTVIDPSFFQRCSAVDKPEKAKKGLFYSIILWFVFDILTITSSLYAFIFIIPKNPLMTFPLLASEVLPPGILGIFIVSLFAIVMSTIDSMSFVNAITFGRDILWRIRAKDAKKNPVFLIKRGLIATGVISLLLSILIPSVVKLFYTLGSIIIPGLILPFINALLTKNNKKINNNYIFSWILIPVLTSFSWYIVSFLPIKHFPKIEPFYPGMFISVLFYLTLLINKKK